jgi:hypothetical protein
MSKNILRHIEDEDFLDEIGGVQRIKRKPKTKDEGKEEKKEREDD